MSSRSSAKKEAKEATIRAGVPNSGSLENWSGAAASIAAEMRQQQSTAEQRSLWAAEEFANYIPKHIAEVKGDARFEWKDLHMGKQYPLWDAARCIQVRTHNKSIYNHWKGVVRPACLNVINPIYMACLNVDGTIPSGTTKDDMAEQVRVELYQREQKGTPSSPIDPDADADPDATNTVLS